MASLKQTAQDISQVGFICIAICIIFDWGKEKLAWKKKYRKKLTGMQSWRIQTKQRPPNMLTISKQWLYSLVVCQCIFIFENCKYDSTSDQNGKYLNFLSAKNTVLSNSTRQGQMWSVLGPCFTLTCCFLLSPSNTEAEQRDPWQHQQDSG